MLLLIDNYDSFTYNLVQYIGELGTALRVVRNDEVSCDEIENDIEPSRIMNSPGPGTPDEAGITLDVLQKFSGRLPILGVCLGHQAIGQFFGGNVIRAVRPVHGRSTVIHHDGHTIFAGVPDEIPVGRYHSLIVERSSLPDVLEVSAETDDGIIMGLRHKTLLIEGVQFHPESILTECGKLMLRNFLEI
jgi:anthranilate synthase/aminodeoxychorismate synthase-like glutamine amidotransferase